MIHAYTLDDDGRLREVREPSTRMLDDAVWMDLVDPSEAELDEATGGSGSIVPSHVDIGEIEATSRYYEDSDGIQVQLHFLDHSADDVRNINVVFALRGERLVSFRERDLAAIAAFLRRVERQAEPVGDATGIFLGILESKIDHVADALETNYVHLEQLSGTTLAVANPDLEEALMNLTSIESLNGKIRINLMDTQRVVSSLLRSNRMQQSRHRLSEVLRDVESLLVHTAFLLEEIGFLSDAVIGLISIEQNRIVKILSVVAVVFLPPTLVASIYGMNFRHLPELAWPLGYPLALIIMLILGIAPLWYARRQHWL